ncbi:dUTP diphosphatase [Candidatus Zinderia endosymbiont of Aphrophora alni]|uniref:dUTP diphosphatase n=1 Tax=Candidatus Zinderia endosymbiont of Aphrophora alni TaxID=3077951 RepID=UPI0030CB23C3
MKNINIKIFNYKIKNKLPKYETNGSAGLDLRACIKNKKIIFPKKKYLIPSGIGIYIKDKNITSLIIPRSGLAHKYNLILGNTIGLIDSDYQGQIMISILNRGKKEFIIEPMMRIAQMIFIPLIKINWNLVEDFKKNKRNNKGFGSTGLI